MDDDAMEFLDELAVSCGMDLKEFQTLHDDELETNVLSHNADYAALVDEALADNDNDNNEEEQESAAFPESITAEPTEALLDAVLSAIKEEFTCESEQMLKQDVEDVFALPDKTDIVEPDDDDDCMQVEVYSTQTSQADEAAQAMIDDGSLLPLVNVKLENEDDLYTSAEAEVSTEEEEVLDDSHLSNIMSDHNYTSQEQALADEEGHVDVLRQSLINYILQKSSKGEASQNQSPLSNNHVIHFVQSILDRIGNFDAEKMHDAELSYSNDERDAFVQNIMDAVVAEDDADEELKRQEKNADIGTTIKPEVSAYTDVAVKKEKDIEEAEHLQGEIEKKKSAKQATKVEQEKTTKKEEPVEVEAEEAKEAKETKKGEEVDVYITPDNIEHNAMPPPAPRDVRSGTISSVTDDLLPENVSEPMEHAASEGALSGLSSSSNESTSFAAGELGSSISTFTTEDQSAESNTEPIEQEQVDSGLQMLSDCSSHAAPITLPLLEQLTCYAKNLLDNCSSFRTDITVMEPKLQAYIKTQVAALQELGGMNSVECGMQTDAVERRSAKHKLNKQSKQALLAYTSSDESSTEESDETDASANESSGDKASVGDPTKHRLKFDKNMVVSAVAHVEQPQHLYDDGVSLSKYVQADVYDMECNSSDERSMSPASLPPTETASEEQGAVSTVDSVAPTVVAAAPQGETVAAQSESDKENDKEIERLINLNGLAKRSVTYASSSLKSDKAATKPKSLLKAKADDLLGDLLEENDLLRDGGGDSDESMHESEEEITEQTYLKRRNEEFKKRLLDSSSSELEEEEEVPHDWLEEEREKSELATEEGADDERKTSPLLDKFLKSFDPDADMESEADDEDVGSPERPLSSTALNLASNGMEKDDQPPASDSPIQLNDSAEKIARSTDNSDCELLATDSLQIRKRAPKQKTLEKMFKEADKRKKTSTLADEELISLSSDSDSSDVEAVDVEPDANKSRILKPMLRRDQLAGETRKAQKKEEERIRRLERKQQQMAKALKEHKDKMEPGDLILDYNEESKTFIKVHPQVVQHLKQHQIDGVKFLYDSCYGGLEALKKSPGSGCILAHCMGLGKTLQLIALLHTVINYKELKTSKILVLCPKSTVMNWADEIKRWIGPLDRKNPRVFTFNDTSDINEKLSVLKEWSQSTAFRAGCLLVGYEAFRTLVFYHSYRNRSNSNSAAVEEIREKVVKYLLKPGADLVVCDEGHIIKNCKSAISLAVAEIVTPKRIILTGTPIQNNLKEYYSMVNFIKPLFLGTEKEFANLYANPIRNGQHKDSNKKDIKIMKQRSFVLHKKLSKFVQRKEAELLKTFLPQKFEYVLFIPMTTVQNNLYKYILNAIEARREHPGRGLITDYTCLRKIWTHPKVLEDAWKNAKQQKNKRDIRQKPPHSDEDQPDDIYDSQTGVMSVTRDWWRDQLTPNDLESVLPSNKLRTMFEILRMCAEKEEKCLIFSAFVAVLNVVEHFFKKLNDGDQEVLKELNMTSAQLMKHSWIVGKDYYRLDGKTSKSIRHEMVLHFNSTSNKRTRVFLISAKAGGQGINLTGANRVIILDTSWNPSNDQQNIFRIFRLGQKRNCYIYRLLAMGTMEEKVYSRSVTKQAMSFRVVDEQQIDRHYSMAELAELYTLTIPDYAQREVPVLPQDFVLASLLRNFPDMVYKYHEHDCLLENKVEQELSEQEKADAWDAYERDMQMSTEIREMPHLDGLMPHMDSMQQQFAHLNKMPNYLGNYAGPDMAALLNYGGLGPQAAAAAAAASASYYNSYNPGQSQSYLEMLNLYHKYTQSYPYRDLNKPMRDTVLNPAALYGVSPSSLQPPSGPASMLNAGPPNLGPPGGMGAASNPLTALGDLSIYPLSVPKNMPPPSTHGASQMASSYEYYKQTLESFYNYPSTSSAAVIAAAVAEKNKYNSSVSAQQLQFMSAAPPPYQPQPAHKPTTSGSNNSPMSRGDPATSSLFASKPPIATPTAPVPPLSLGSRKSPPSLSPPGMPALKSVLSATVASFKSATPLKSQLPPVLPPINVNRAPVPAPPLAPQSSGKPSAAAPPPWRSLPTLTPQSARNMGMTSTPLNQQQQQPPTGNGNNKPSVLSANNNQQSVNSNNNNNAQPSSTSNNKPPLPSNNSKQQISVTATTTTPTTTTRTATAAAATNAATSRTPGSNSAMPPAVPLKINSSAKTPVPPNSASGKTPVQSNFNSATSPTGGLVGGKISMQKILQSRAARKALNASRMAVSSRIPTNYSSSPVSVTPAKPTPSMAAAAAAQQRAKPTSGAATPTLSGSTSALNNMGIKYPTPQTKGEMQIIPTTTSSSAASSNVAKQYADISPNISLTALRNTSTVGAVNKTSPTLGGINNNSRLGNTNITAKQTQQSQQQQQITVGSKSKAPSAAQQFAANKILSNLAKKMPNPTQLPNPKAQNASGSQFSPAVKTAAAHAVLAKANNTTNLQSFLKSNAGSEQQRSASPVTSSAQAAAAMLKRGDSIIKRVKEGGGITSPITIGQRTGGGLTITATNSPTAGSSGGAGGASKGLPGGFKIISKSTTPGSTGAVTIQKRGSLAAFAKSAPSATITPTAAANTTTATTKPLPPKSSLSIRPVDGRTQSPGIYIIEQNVNEKRVTIGAPTRSGGGTTITKITPGMKRQASGEKGGSGEASGSGGGGGAAAVSSSSDAKRPKLTPIAGVPVKLN